MLELKELAQYLTERLNTFAISTPERYKFLIYAELGKSVPDTICGVLKTNEPTITPINGIKNIRYNSVVQLSLPAPTGNYTNVTATIKNAEGEIVKEVA